jgi:hypothetical protein
MEDGNDGGQYSKKTRVATLADDAGLPGQPCEKK